MSAEGEAFAAADYTLALRGLRIQAILGLYPEERHRVRDLILDTRIRLSGPLPPDSAPLEDLLDYASLAARLAAALQDGRFRLLEAAADACRRLIMADPRVRGMWLCLRKPGAVPSCDEAAVELRAGDLA